MILQSKWFNAVTIAVIDTTFDPFALLELPMVTTIKSVQCIEGDLREPLAAEPSRETVEPSAYGGGLAPLQQLNADWLHGLGFRGEGMTIAVLDAGFENTESLPIFQRAWNEGRIKKGLTPCIRKADCLLITGTARPSLAPWPGTGRLTHWNGAGRDFCLAAPKTRTANTSLKRTTGGRCRARGQHRCRSHEHLLGYSLFDDSTMNHMYDDLNGTTTRISQAAEWAAQYPVHHERGNSGAAAWHYITAPADADGILTVGAVNADGQHAVFSGWGPTADGRVKPDVMALGVQAAYPFADSTIRRGNGTSFSSPILCGAAACLWQAFPTATAQDIRNAITTSAHLYSQPNDSMGTAFPIFEKRLSCSMRRERPRGPRKRTGSLIFPNPSSDGILRWLYKGDEPPTAWQLFDAGGHLLDEGNVPAWSTAEGHFQGHTRIADSSPNGTYIFQLTGSDGVLISRRWVLMR